MDDCPRRCQYMVRDTSGSRSSLQPAGVPGARQAQDPLLSECYGDLSCRLGALASNLEPTRIDDLARNHLMAKPAHVGKVLHPRCWDSLYNRILVIDELFDRIDRIVLKIYELQLSEGAFEQRLDPVTPDLVMRQREPAEVHPG